ncbi:MAG: carboxy-S-adenosyl-L-methionine synthase CmoA [Candidatus Scalindua rubra]|nr:carboxy-S-adenosyl-L-methionine synthase CmoA [Candidatus Scalindua rubra]TWU38071.1 tRNA (cmo5U34)-methyltransferase [Candidatus Brocadiaceae bacterium S225]
MSKDKIFVDKKDKVSDFNFGKETAAVFDDMLERSVPFYKELQRMMCEIAVDFAVDGTNIYDLGCSTGITLSNICDAVTTAAKMDVKYIGIDYSQNMLDKCGERFAENKLTKDYSLICADLNNGVNITNASVVVMNLTLQFVRPLHREQVIKSIFNGLNANGCLILLEKVLGNNSDFNRMFIKYYYEMKKKNGYTELEIAQKREALENILVPYRLDENKALLKKSGFVHYDTFFKWYNFCGVVALKSS